LKCTNQKKESIGTFTNIENEPRRLHFIPGTEVPRATIPMAVIESLRPIVQPT